MYTEPPTPQASLTRNPDHFSDNAWDLLLAAQDIAHRWRHAELDVEHILQVLFSDCSYQKWIIPLGINTGQLLHCLEDILAEQPAAHGEKLFIGEDLEQLLEAADCTRNSWGSKLIDVNHLLVALGRDPRIGHKLLEQFGCPTERIESLLNPTPAAIPATASPRHLSSSLPLENGIVTDIEPQALDLYGRDLTRAAQSGDLDPVIGRDNEIRQLVRILVRRGKNNPVLIGAPGVGKTAIAELLAQKIIIGEVPEVLQGLRLVALDLGALIAGAKLRGQFEERLRSVLDEVSRPNSGVVLFIDELHSMLRSDRSSTDAASLLKPSLAQGRLRCIAATTAEDYSQTVERDPALNRRFQQVLVQEPTLELSIEILRGLKECYELHHGVTISDAAVVAANRLADRYISDRCLPDKAIDLIDEAAAQLKMDATSKPQIIEAAEESLRHQELALLAAEVTTAEEHQRLNQAWLSAANRLDELRNRWQMEQKRLAEFRHLQQQDEKLQHDIAKAKVAGDFKELTQLQYNQKHCVRQRRDELESILAKEQTSGHALLRDQVEAEDIADVVARWTGIPVQRLLAGERQKLLQLEGYLSSCVIGQPKAVQAVAAAIRRARAGMKNPCRPVGSFLFLGPTGVGKTELAKALAASLFDDPEALIRLDMSEFMERNAVARLLGAPPGYIGYEEGGQLTGVVRRRPYAVLLLDEIEKAHPDVFNILLQVLDDGRLTDSQGRTVNFRHTVIVMTSNLASRAILDASTRTQRGDSNEPELPQELEDQVNHALTQHFRPEFLNRIDELIHFRPLSLANLESIVRLQLNDLTKLLSEQDLELVIDDESIHTLARLGNEPEYGARPLRRVLRRFLENPLATEILEQRFQNCCRVLVRATGIDEQPFRFEPQRRDSNVQ